MGADMKAQGWSKEQADQVIDTLEGQFKPVWDGVREPSIPIVVTKENPKKGTIIVETSYNADKDLYRLQPHGDDSKLSDANMEYLRPALDNDKTKAVVWSDMVMDNWRVSAHAAGVPVDSLSFIVRDKVQTPATRQLVKELHRGQNGKKIWKKGTPEFEKMSKDKVHGDRSNKLVTDNKEELEGIEIPAFETNLSDGGTRIDIKILTEKPE